MKIFERLYNFIEEYEELFKIIIVMLGLLLIACVIVKKYDTELTKEKNIIEQTKKYEKYNECKKINETWYCWNEEKE